MLALAAAVEKHQNLKVLVGKTEPTDIATVAENTLCKYEPGTITAVAGTGNVFTCGNVTEGRYIIILSASEGTAVQLSEVEPILGGQYSLSLAGPLRCKLLLCSIWHSTAPA